MDGAGGVDAQRCVRSGVPCGGGERTGHFKRNVGRLRERAEGGGSGGEREAGRLAGATGHVERSGTRACSGKRGGRAGEVKRADGAIGERKGCGGRPVGAFQRSERAAGEMK